MAAVVVADPYGRRGGERHLALEDVERRELVAVDLYTAVVQLCDGLDLYVVSVNTVRPLSGKIRIKVLNNVL